MPTQSACELVRAGSSTHWATARRVSRAEGHLGIKVIGFSLEGED